jgi:hypothetical protein
MNNWVYGYVTYITAGKHDFLPIPLNEVEDEGSFC